MPFQARVCVVFARLAPIPTKLGLFNLPTVCQKPFDISRDVFCCNQIGFANIDIRYAGLHEARLQGGGICSHFSAKGASVPMNCIELW